MATAADLIHETRQHLQSYHREEQNQLNGAVTSGATSLTFLYALGGITPGSYVQLDLELFYVWAVAGQVATVTGAQMGTTAASHANSSVAVINPKFPDFAILRALNADLASLSSPLNGLFAVKTTDLAYTPSTEGYVLPADTQDVLEVTTDTPGPDNSHPLVGGWRVVRNNATSEFSTGIGLIVDNGYSGFSLRVRYKAAFTPLAVLATDVTVTGLPVTAYDLPPMGAALRLVVPREVERNNTSAQGNPRRAEEVPPGAVARSAGGLAGLRAMRIAEEASRLQQTYLTRHTR